MNNNENQITADEARSSLESVKNIKTATITSLRPPLWLNIGGSALFGIVTASATLQGANGGWTLMLCFSALMLTATFLFWLRYSKTLGAKTKVFPMSFKSKVFFVAQAAFYAIVMFVAKESYQTGTSLAPYGAAAINSIVFLYLVHNYPTTEWRAKAASQ